MPLNKNKKILRDFQKGLNKKHTTFDPHAGKLKGSNKLVGKLSQHNSKIKVVYLLCILWNLKKWHSKIDWKLAHQLAHLVHQAADLSSVIILEVTKK
jgi:hypothetical protein